MFCTPSNLSVAPASLLAFVTFLLSILRAAITAIARAPNPESADRADPIRDGSTGPISLQNPRQPSPRSAPGFSSHTTSLGEASRRAAPGPQSRPTATVQPPALFKLAPRHPVTAPSSSFHLTTRAVCPSITAYKFNPNALYQLNRRHSSNAPSPSSHLTTHAVCHSITAYKFNPNTLYQLPCSSLDASCLDAFPSPERSLTICQFDNLTLDSAEIRTRLRVGVCSAYKFARSLHTALAPSTHHADALFKLLSPTLDAWCLDASVPCLDPQTKNNNAPALEACLP